jgi:hypothetical protein
VDHKRISVASVVATSGGSILACAVMLSASLAIANPNSGANPKSLAGNESFSGMDLPMAPARYQDPTVAPPPPIQPPTETPDDDDGDDPRDTPPPVFFGEEIDVESDSIIYVVDHSGSMSLQAESFEVNGQVQSGNRLDRAKAELKSSIANLPETFFFNVIFYDECVTQCWSKKQQASNANKQNAFAWIDSIQPDGWTNTGLATQTALADKTNKMVVLLSDGAPNFIDCAMNYVGSFVTHQDMIKNENTQQATVNTFGIGISSDNDARAFMQKVASDNGGQFTEIN